MADDREHQPNSNRQVSVRDIIVGDFNASTLIILVVIAVVSRVFAEYLIVGLGVRGRKQPVVIAVGILIIIIAIIVLNNRAKAQAPSSSRR